jgi:phosphoenolpyruvate-protein phosphotransferase (PTS system enzyme I)
MLLRQLQGVGASPGVVVGPALHVVREIPASTSAVAHVEDADGEKARTVKVLEALATDLEARGRRAGGEAHAVLSAQAMMARDPGLRASAAAGIDSGETAVHAVSAAFGAYRSRVADAGPYLEARAADLDDLRDRAVARLLGLPEPGLPDIMGPCVLVARDLAPADVVELDPRAVLGIVMEEGGPTSHTAILARAKGIAVVAGCAGATGLPPGAVLIVDGRTGLVHVDPSAEEIAEAQASSAAVAASLDLGSGPGMTGDGTQIPLLANVGGRHDIEAALAAGAEGVGLYRTESLFLDRTLEPSEQEQASAYTALLSAFPGHTVVIRVLDAGADKPIAFLSSGAKEPNPALGVRGLRALQHHRSVLDTQLRALAAAAQQAGVQPDVMAPFVTDAADARWFAEACREAGFSGRIGAMIEVPAAALRAASIAAEVDFLSIGTNDLAQYAFAADRQVHLLSHLQDPWQPALLDLVACAAAAAIESGRPCGVCGEAAADPALACVLVGLGVTSLSMTAAALPGVRAALRLHTLEQCRQAAAIACQADAAAVARSQARAALPALDELGL